MKLSRPSREAPWALRAAATAIAVIALAWFPQALFAEDAGALFRGEVGSSIGTLIASDGEFDSVINPSNALGLTDLSVTTSANLRVERRSDIGSLDFRIDFSAYPIGDALSVPYALAGAPDPALAYAAGDSIWSAEITRAAVLWYASHSAQITLGRQTLVRGYGLAWSPYDLASPLRDPADPSGFVRGVDAISLTVSPSWRFALTAYTLLPEGTTSFEGIVAGTDVNLLAGPAEVRIAGLFGGEEEGIADPYPHSAAIAAYIDLLGAGLYGEAAMRSRSRLGILESDGTQAELNGPIWSALGGLEYVFPSGATLLVEYFFNGEGWNKDQRESFVAGVVSAPTLANLSLYRPGAYSRHYTMFNLLIPLFGSGSEVTASSLFAVDTGTMILNPSLNVTLDQSGNLTGEVMYAGVFDLYGEEASEARLSPAEHQVTVGLRFAF